MSKDTYTVAEWETYPYTAYDKRNWTVYHRVRLVCYDRNTADVVVERKIPKEGLTTWTEVESYELRAHGVTHVEKAGGES